MALERHIVELAARDQLSPALQKVSAAADKAGKAGEDAGKRAGRSMQDWSRIATGTGVALGGLIGITSKLGQAHLSESRQIRALDRAYGDQAEAVKDLAAEMQGLGIASDDAVRISALGASALITNYQLTSEEINNLIRVSADLTAITFDQQGNQLQLADVMQRVSGAIRGEGEAAELLGLSMSDSAVAAAAAAAGLEGWTTTMTEAEKAQFRYTLLLEQAAYAQGAAAEQADTLSGKVNALKLQLFDGAAAFGGLLGPAGESLAVMGDLALAAPLAGAGIGKLAVGMGAATKAMIAFNAAGKAGLVGTLIAIAPAAAVAAVSIGGLAVAVHKGEEGTKGLVEEINALGAAFDNLPDPALDESWNRLVAQTANPAQVEAIVYGNKRIVASMNDFKDELAFIRTDVPTTIAVLDSLARQGVTLEDGLSLDELPIVMATLTSFNVQLKDSGVQAGEAGAAQMALASALAGSGDGADKATVAATRLNKAEQAEIATSRAASEARWAEADAKRNGTYVNEELTASIARGAEGAARYRDETDEMIAVQVEAAAAAEAQAQAVLAATQSYAGMVGTTQALDAGISVIIGGLDNLGGGIKKVADSTTAMFDWSDGWAEADQLLYDGRISVEQYDAAWKATSDTQANAATAQSDMNAILVMQSPLLADLAWQQQQYITGLRELPAEEQLLALAYMDSAEAAKALELQTLALSAANGEMGEGGAGFAKDIIRGAAEADPILKAMLVDMGLISVGAEGTIKVNFPDEGTSEIALLTDSINVLITTLGGVPPLTKAKVELEVDDAEAVDTLLAFGGVGPDGLKIPVGVDTTEGQSAVMAKIAEWGGLASTSKHYADTSEGDTSVSKQVAIWGGITHTSTHYADVSAADATVAGAVSAYDTFAATVDILSNTAPYYGNLPATGVTLGTNYVSIVGVRSGIGFDQFADGGLIDHAAVGGMRRGMVMVGERGPELVSLPGGSLVHNNSASRGMRGNGGGGDTVTINIGTVVANDARQFAQSMRQYDRTGRNA